MEAQTPQACESLPLGCWHSRLCVVLFSSPCPSPNRAIHPKVHPGEDGQPDARPGLTLPVGVLGLGRGGGVAGWGRPVASQSRGQGCGEHQP